MNIQDLFHLGLTGLISLLSNGLPRVFSNTIVQKHQFFGTQPFLWSSSHIHSFSSKEQVPFNLTAAVTICSDFGTQENKVCHCFHCFPIYLPWSDGTGSMILVFWMLSFKPAFSLSFTFIKRLFSSSLLSAITVVSSACPQYTTHYLLTQQPSIDLPSRHHSATIYFSTIHGPSINHVSIHIYLLIPSSHPFSVSQSLHKHPLFILHPSIIPWFSYWTSIHHSPLIAYNALSVDYFSINQSQFSVQVQPPSIYQSIHSSSLNCHYRYIHYPPSSDHQHQYLPCFQHPASHYLHTSLPCIQHILLPSSIP